MDPLSITVACIGLVATVTKTSLVVGGFVKDVRAARSDLDGVSRELLSLKTVLELLADDVTDSPNEALPQTLQKQIAGIITNCTGVVVDIEETIKKHEGRKVTKAAQWAAFGQKDMEKLRSSLEAHKSALEIALEMLTLTMAREIKADTRELLNDTSAIKEDTAQILAEIARLQEQLPRDAQRDHASGFMLERYLNNLTSYAETVYDTLSENIDERRSSENGSINQQRTTSPISRPSSIAEEVQMPEGSVSGPYLRDPRGFYNDLDDRPDRENTACAEQETIKPRRRSVFRDQEAIAALGTTAFAVGGEELWNRKYAYDSNAGQHPPTERRKGTRGNFEEPSTPKQQAAGPPRGDTARALCEDFQKGDFSTMLKNLTLRKTQETGKHPK
ncbi:hypothetical protein DL98DRAFT_186622 [Cadophora sp. DSE1049]|nr:hypothetical protein DL98DRAFT_186622 [Cadophora sp. DSE1049]